MYILPKEEQGCHQGHPTLTRGKDGIPHHEFNWDMEEAMQDQPNNNPPKDLVDRKESDVSIGTQPEEERSQRHQMIEASE